MAGGMEIILRSAPSIISENSWKELSDALSFTNPSKMRMNTEDEVQV